MSQQAVETVLGRLITDTEFHLRFFAGPAEVCREHEIVLTSRETGALLQLSVQALHGMMAGLDPKIVRASVMSPGQSLSREKSTVRRTERCEGRSAAGVRRA